MPVALPSRQRALRAQRRPARGRARLAAAARRGRGAPSKPPAPPTASSTRPSSTRSRPPATSTRARGRPRPASRRRCMLAPGRAPAQPSPERRWAEIEVDEEVGVIRRPPGVRIDSGGIGKGLAADLLAERLQSQSRFVVSCGGDLRVGGADREPFEVLVEHPLTARARPEPSHRRRRGRHLRDQRPGLAPRRRPLRPSPARPLDRRAGVDRADRGHGPGADRGRGRDALEGCPALGAGGCPPPARPPRWFDRPRRRRGRAGRPDRRQPPDDRLRRLRRARRQRPAARAR